MTLSNEVPDIIFVTCNLERRTIRWQDKTLKRCIHSAQTPKRHGAVRVGQTSCLIGIAAPFLHQSVPGPVGPTAAGRPPGQTGGGGGCGAHKKLLNQSRDARSQLATLTGRTRVTSVSPPNELAAIHLIPDCRVSASYARMEPELDEAMDRRGNGFIFEMPI